MNAAASFVKMNVSPVLPNMAYFGCNVVGSTMSRYADFELYEFSIYTRVLSDLYTVVNSKNARLEGPISDPAVLADYNDWKKKNFIERSEDDPSIPTSVFYENQDGKVSESMARNIASNSIIPTMFLSFQNDTEEPFSSENFYKKHKVEDSSATYRAVGDYYDPESGQPVEGVNVRVQLQGTTTLGYRVKNLELMMDEYVTIDGIEVPVLFQPKKEWFPEKQFTLKADVVDSSHANNAVIGEWINNCGILHDNPAMLAFNDNTRPKDVDNQGNPKRHMSNGRDIDFDEDVQIRHTLEGFPILLFISFAGEDDYTFVGIYSFNLGRFSYYNMGLRFLESFSRRGSDGNRVSCPAIIRYYKEKPTLGTINSDTDVYSFEFGNAGNIKVADYPVWSQYNKAVVQSYGEFKYPSVGADHAIWNKLCELFEYAATSPIDSYNGDAVTTFDGIKPWTIDELGHYTQTSTEPIGQQADNYEYLAERIETWNAAVYYVIANAFGMSDSLGKNMVLRTWDGGNSWWTAFYDMDTALALVNNGAEDNPVTMAVDRIHTETDPTTQRTITGITYHDENSKYAAYLSKLWGLLRCDGLLYRIGGEELRDRKRYYEDIWSQFRQRGGLLSTSDKFVDMMKSKVDRCGELIYNFDYRSKYILDTYEQNEEEGVFPAINFLHGTRVGFVREWLKKHFYFLDGLFDASRFSGLSTRLYEDSPYYNEAFVMTVSFNSAIRNLLLTFRVATPTFIAVTTGNDRVMTRFYIDKENVDTQIFIPNNTSDGSQLSITSASILTKIGGLTDGFQNITVSNAAGIVHSIVEFVTGPSNKLSNVNPFRSEPFVLAGESSLEKLDLSGTKWPIKLDSYEVNLGNFERLLWVDVSNSHVTSITLPKSSLDYLNVSYTDIKSLEVVSQNKLTGVSLNGCDAINNIKFSDCENVSAVTVDNKRNLVRFEVSNCQSVSAITITDCPNLQSIVISNNKALKSITINNTVQYGIDCDVSIIGCTGLENFTYQGSTNSRPILMDYFSASGIKNLDLYACSKFAGIKYNEESDIEMYEDHYVLDLSKMTSLENVSLTNVSTLMYLRTNNDIDGVPVKISVSALYGTAIKRIFGYIEINSGGVFSMRPDFYLNDMGQKQTVSGNVYEYGQWNDRSENLADYFFTGEYDLNIKLNTNDLSRLMNGTGANLGDVYYLLSLCDSRVKNTSYMFRDCQNIVIESEIDWSTGTWPTEYCGFDENMFKYCTALEDANYMFYGCTNVGGVVPIKVMHDLSSSVKSFSYVFPGGMFYDCGQSLFVDNNDIEIVEGFNPIFTNQHDFVPADEDYWTRFGMYASDIMNGLDNVTEIINSFNGSQFGFHSGEKGELLRGKKKIKKIVNSFNGMVMRDPWEQVHYLLCDPDSPQNYPQGLQIIDNSFNTSFDDTRGNIVYFGDSFFSAFKGSLTTIANSFKSVNRAPETADCQYGGFPYKIFEGMTKIQHIVGFFEGFCLFGNAFMDTNEEVIDGTPLDITLPSYVNGNTRYDMFGTCTQLSDVSACFKKMKYGSYTIVGDGFKNNRITRVDELFNEDNSYGEDEYYTNENKALRKGMIPFHLFYQEDNGEELHLITNMNSVFRGTASTAVTFYSMDTTSNDIVDYLRNEDGSYVWNIYKHDGTSAFADKIAYFHSHISDVRTAHPELFEGATPLYPDNVVPDELMDYQNEPLDADQMTYNVIGGDYGEVAKRDIFTVRNYFCPPDIFRYCENTPTIDISAIFLKASYGIVDGETTNPRVSGYYGKCPPMLFRPISNLYTMDEVFYGFKMMLPYSWKNGAKQYPPQLFSPLTSVRFMNRTFMETTLWGATDGDPMTVENVFDSFGQSLTIANGLWNNANWIGNSQISSALFNSCSRLEDVSDMFAKNGPLVIYKDLFLAASTTLITVSGFMERNQRTGGQVPDFWVSSVYPKIRNNDRTYYSINGSEGYITNYSSIPDSYKNG